MAETEHGEGAAASTPVGVVLAGGAGRRLGGLGKASIELAGRPLLDYPISALREVCAEVAVVAKRDSRLPALPASVARWNEPDEPRHPLTGILHALERSAGRGVLVCAVDMPLVDAATLRALLALVNACAGALAVVAGGPDGLQPLLAVYAAAAHEPLLRATPERPLRESIAELHPVLFEPPDAEALANVNTPADLARAEEQLLVSRRSPTSSAPAE